MKMMRREESKGGASGGVARKSEGSAGARGSAGSAGARGSEGGVMQGLVNWLDPRLEKYREPRPVPLWTPESVEEFVALVGRTPAQVLDAHQKKLLAKTLSFEERLVSEVMLPREKMVFVTDTEFLGPLTLDNLYKSGFSHFPVVDKERHMLGLLHTEALNQLEVKENLLARDFIDKNVFYARGDYLLTEALAVMLRNDRDYLIIIDEYERLVGMITMAMIIKALLGYVPEDEFKQDDSAAAVAKRRFE